MPSTSPRLLRTSIVLALCAAAAGCGSMDGVSRRIASAVTPYKVEVVQGNFVSREQVEQLKPGMSRQQVRDLLGTPLVTSLFHDDRWDYVFTLKRDGVQEQPRRLTVFFSGEALQRFEGDTMPSESEFVAAIGSKPREVRQPALQASEEQLQRATAATRPAASPQAPTTSGSAAPPPATSYPPLETPAR
ncbi:outer membrane protein assembly factor BamE [Ramlibacter henchirensis]|uniref:Outer membrane protein assembly factor BamE n=1 Tax=Ramlibacter henchirensis TaxID=204072 RepID=A0A4Z0C4T5_9BURK|nr:outer membrane protein assembly factor BamE [Ramlibacter henchirensis]TFZ06646.1 outer membrane protein assembly factor BamE [Ramlibacter henchirensis]